MQVFAKTSSIFPSVINTENVNFMADGFINIQLKNVHFFPPQNKNQFTTIYFMYQRKVLYQTFYSEIGSKNVTLGLMCIDRPMYL